MLEITKMLIISTAHMPQEFLDYITLNPDEYKISQKYGTTVRPYEYGCYVWCFANEKDLVQRKDEIDPDLYEVMLFAMKHDCNWVCLDSDAETVDELKNFEEEEEVSNVSFTETIEKLKELIIQYPDYRLCVMCGEDANIGDCSWMVATDVRFHIGEVLNKAVTFSERIYVDRNMFEEDLSDYLCDTISARRGRAAITDEEACEDDILYKEMFAEEKAKYDPYWEKCIVIYANN